MTRSKIDGLKEGKPSRFLVVKFGSLGDIVHCLPSVSQLRKAFPEAEIDWLIERKNKIVVELSGLDVRLIPIDTYQWRNSPGIGSAKEIAELVWALSTDGYDCTIDFQGLLKSAFFAYLSGAPVRIGWERDFLKETVSRFFYTEVVTPKRIHIIDQQMELLKPLGIDPVWETEVPLRPGDLARISVEKKLAGLSDYIVINPGGNWPTKCWHPERYGELAARLTADGFPVVVTWGPGEEQMAKTLLRTAGKGVRDRPHALCRGRGHSDRHDLRPNKQRSKRPVPPGGHRCRTAASLQAMLRAGPMPARALALYGRYHRRPGLRGMP